MGKEKKGPVFRWDVLIGWVPNAEWDKLLAFNDPWHLLISMDKFNIYLDILACDDKSLKFLNLFTSLGKHIPNYNFIYKGL